MVCLITSLVQVKAGKLDEDVVSEKSRTAQPGMILAGLLHIFLFAVSSGLHSVIDVLKNPSCLPRTRTNFCEVALFCYYISNANKRMTEMASRMGIAVRS